MVATLETLSIAAAPSELRSRIYAMNEELQRKCMARIQAINVLKAVPRSEWRRVAGRLSAQLSFEFARGFSAKTLLDLFRDYRRDGMEVVLFDYSGGSKRPVEFVREIARRAGNNKRVASVALQSIIADWRAGNEVPGYGTWRDAWARQYKGDAMPAECPFWFIPHGWSERNLRRDLPGQAALTLARKGHFAAHGKLPQVRLNYSGLMPLEAIVYDDVRMDFLVSYPGHTRSVEMWLLVAMDVATRMVLDWVSLAAVPDDEGKRAALLEEHMRILVGSVLRRYGVPSGWTMTHKVENAKATLREADRQMLAALSGGQIVVEHTKMHTRTLANGRKERHGSPWEKPIEVFFNTLHNHTAMLPGHTGARYDLAPAELDSRKKEHAELVRAAADMPAELVAKINLPFMRYNEAVDTLTEIFHKLNNRTNHNLNGFADVETFRFPDEIESRPLEELRRYPRADVKRAIIESRKESPAERFDRLLHGAKPCMRVPEDALVPFMAHTVKRVRHPAPFTIAWTEQGTKFEYRGEIEALRTGDADAGRFHARLLPGNLSIAYLYDAKTGAQLGRMDRVDAPRIGDRKAQERALGEVQHYRSIITREVDATHAPDREEKTRRDTLNRSIIDAARAGRSMVEDAAQARVETAKERKARQRKRDDINQALAQLARSQQAREGDADLF